MYNNMSIRDKEVDVLNSNNRWGQEYQQLRIMEVNKRNGIQWDNHMYPNNRIITLIIDLLIN